MCPLRFILVFFSAVLAGYVAWRTVRTSQESELTMVSEDYANEPPSEKQELTYVKMMQNGFWVLVDMASGRYLWRNIKEMKRAHTNEEESKRDKLAS